MGFSEKLQKIRKDNNITQEGLADKLNVSRQAVSKWESGSAYPDTEKLIQISKIFNISLDDLINDNIDIDKSKNNNTKKLDFMAIINQVLDFISKSINMFFTMKLTEKIKCLFEMGILILIIDIIGTLSSSLIINILRRILMFLPDNFIYFVCSLFEVLFLLTWIVIGLIIVIKIFKSRYLDYYVFIKDNSIDERIIEEPIKELKEKKEYKIVIRDPKDSSLNIFKKISSILFFIIKCFCFVLLLPLILFFIFFIIILVCSLFCMLDGMFFNGISICIIGIILFIYLMLEFIYNLIFNRVHMLNRIFVIFIISISLIGIGMGLSLVSLSSFSYDNNIIKNNDIHNIEMNDDLVLYPLIYEINDSDIIIDNKLDNIKLEVISYGNMNSYLYSYDSYRNNNSFKIIEIGYEYDEIGLYKDIFNGLKNKKIVKDLGESKIKIYVSIDNLTKLRENINKYTGNIYFE